MSDRGTPFDRIAGSSDWPDERRMSEDCRCITRVSWDGALIVIADSECARHRPAILDVQK